MDRRENGQLVVKHIALLAEHGLTSLTRITILSTVSLAALSIAVPGGQITAQNGIQVTTQGDTQVREGKAGLKANW